MIKNNIMVVDDEKMILKLLRAALHDAGYNVFTFENAESALQSLDQCLPDLIISDLMMPNMNGIEFCQHIKADARVANIPFVFLTAYGDKDYMISGLEAGAVDFITKPISLNTFLPKIANLLKQVKKREIIFSIIFVDSSPMLLSVTKRKLSEAGFSVTTARKAEEAIERIHTRTYNLIISSVELSGMDGFEFCKNIKESVFKETPFVLFSGNISQELIDKGIAVGVNDFWDKSISPEGLEAKVKAIARQNESSIDFKGGMEGSLSEMNALELIQMIGMNQKTGILSFIGSSLEGHIHFNEGKIINATTLMSSGESAYYNLVTIGSDGIFHFIPTERETNIAITEGLQGLLLEGAKILDDIERIKEKVILPTKQKPQNIDKNEADFLSHIDGEQTFGNIISAAKVEPYHGFEMLTNLADKGLIQSPIEKEDDPDDLIDNFF